MKIYGVECDIFIPNLNIGIEVDGYHWHKDKYDFGKGKVIFLINKGIWLIRVRGKGLKQTSEHDIYFSRKDHDFVIIGRIVNKLLEVATISDRIRYAIEKYLQMGRIANEREYVKLASMLPSPLPGNSQQDFNPVLSMEWHPIENYPSMPSDVFPQSNRKVWWLCNRGHKWQAIINNRSKGHGCPYCKGKSADYDSCLQTVNSHLAKQRHPGKNDWSPVDIRPGSNKTVWWMCDKEHEWQATVANRSKGDGCPYCSGRLATNDNCLCAINSPLAKEWHPVKNDNLTTKDVKSNSGKKVWWLCSEGHEWEAVIATRNRGSGCPICSKNRKKEKDIE